MEQSRASEALEQALKEQNIEANIDTSGVVKISDSELFDVNSYELSEKGKQYLSKFAPAYLNSIFSTKSNILPITLDKGPNLEDNALKPTISS